MTGPVISGVGSANLKGNRFEITWNTNEPATSKVNFTNGEQMSDSALVTQHSLTFRGGRGVLYEYFVTSVDAALNSTTEGPFMHQN